jgi:hypothetical protein
MSSFINYICWFLDRMSVLYLNDLYDLQKLHEDENLSQTYILIPGNYKSNCVFGLDVFLW